LSLENKNFTTKATKYITKSTKKQIIGSILCVTLRNPYTPLWLTNNTLYKFLISNTKIIPSQNLKLRPSLYLKIGADNYIRINDQLLPVFHSKFI